MNEHAHPRAHPDPSHGHRHEEGLAQLLDLDAAISGTSGAEVTAWVTRYAVDSPGRIIDLGTGTGTGALALARRFPAAEVVAVDRSPVMLDRVRAAARHQELGDRVHAVHADLDAAWPAVGAADLVWASSFLHEVSDPGAVLARVRAALRPGGLLAVVEMAGLPRFLPDDLGFGRPGLEARCHQALADAGWNAHPDWRPLLEQTGFEVHGPHTVSSAAHPEPRATARYAQAWLSHMRPTLQDRLDAEDLAVLDHLLAPDRPESLLHRGDLRLRAGRTVWAAGRPDARDRH
ncbi:class I SAM-dependent methyltransferase [Kocuria nitroreducens]|uniref:class I SAM-dependent methyltransferase n=1 Tax=Kocuria nitroreducens TaxID=3058914 RepID=UPI0036DDC5A8